VSECDLETSTLRSPRLAIYIYPISFGGVNGAYLLNGVYEEHHGFQAICDLEQEIVNRFPGLHIYIYIYTGCPRRNVPDFGRVFLMLKYTDIT
jgi:hypothetical protein